MSQPELGDHAPTFTATVGTSDHESFDLEDHLGDGPVVLAFFPGAFTSVCTTEMCTFRDRLGSFEDVDATVFGVSGDSPFALDEFREQHDLSFPLVSDYEKELMDAYDVRSSFDHIGLDGVAKRAVFVVDTDGEITYAWVSDDPGVEPNYDEVVDAASAAH